MTTDDNRQPFGIDEEGAWFAPFRSDGTCPKKYHYKDILNKELYQYLLGEKDVDKD